MNPRLFGQCVLQLIGLMVATVRSNNRELEPGDHHSDIPYALPFDGEWYVANGGVTKAVSHSWDTLPQRFAYDFFQVDEDGRRFCGDPGKLESYYCYGQDVLAPADGVVVAVKRHFPDCRIMDDGRPDPRTPDIGGNRVVMRHGSGEYSVVCHLMPESVTVQKGQAVKRGEVIAKCGNSGNTTEPHIHFQLQSSAGFYSGLGVPVRFRGITARSFANYAAIDPRPRPAAKDGVDGYIHRGLLVRNLG